VRDIGPLSATDALLVVAGSSYEKPAGYDQRLLLPAPPFGLASPPPQLCGPMSVVDLRGLVESRFAARPNGRPPA
jgi:hypothetical protein